MTDALLRLLADASVRVTVLAVLVSAILAILRVHASGVRHAAWTGLLLAMLVMPVLPSILPRIAIPTPTEAPVLSSPFSRAGSRSIEETVSRGASARARVVQQTQAAIPTAVAGPAAFSPVSVPGSGVPWNWIGITVGVYAAGVFVSLISILIGWRAANRLKRTSQPLAISFGPARRTPIGTRVGIQESALVATPLTIGIVRPTIILPLSWRSWPGDTLRAVLVHETAHVTRRDPLVFFVARINCCVFWFHPVAWWLERRLAATAEQASDEEAVRAIGERQRYAEILLDMARTVSRRGARLSWQGIAISGNGLLGRRIDRVLNGSEAPLPAARTFLVAGSCAAVMLIAAACQLVSSAASYELTTAEAQREERLRADLEALKRRPLAGLAGPRRTVTREDVAALDAAAKKDPNDMAAAAAVLLAYWSYGTADVQTATPLPEPRVVDASMAASRRERILWLIEHHPESDLTGSVEGRIFPTAVVPGFPADPDGYQRAKRLWLGHVEKPTVTPGVLGNASYFFETSEPALAEQMLLRARAIDPQGSWTLRLGRLYGSLLTAFTAPRSPYRIAEYRASNPFAQVVRRTLGESRDETMLTAAGWFMAHTGGWRMESDPFAWAEACFKRVLLLNPKAVFAHAELLHVRERQQQGSRPLWSPPLASLYESIAALPDAERFPMLPELARSAYSGAVGDARWNDPNLSGHIAIEKTQARLFAEDALRLAPRFRDHPRYGTAILTANLTLGSLALAEGNRPQALEYLRKASRAPASEELTYGEQIVWGIFVHLPADLLALGERTAVAEYLERMAAVNLAERTVLREKAAAIRRGETPRL